jgi:glycosyltransferase involved in cell wall biosynthesis
MRVLVIAKLFPNRARPLADPFNRQQFAALARIAEIEVVAPLPWFPGARAFARWSDAGLTASVPLRDEVEGMIVHHPRILHLPRVGHPVSGVMAALSLLPLVRRFRGRLDVVLGSWAYPHGVAAVALSRYLGVASAVKVHGSDINVVSEMIGPRQNLQLVLPHADRVVAVSRALARKVEALGVDPARIDVVYNGVNTEIFHVRDRAAARRELKRAADEQLVLYVGWLNETKGVFELAEAFEQVARTLPRISLVMIGEGPARAQLERRAGLAGRVTFTGGLPLSEVALWMGACDLLVLPSWREGTPNVVLEALASGRRVVASRVGGIPDLIHSDRLGLLAPPRNPGALASALANALTGDYDADEVARLGGAGSWQDSAEALLDALQRAVASYRSGRERDRRGD